MVSKTELERYLEESNLKQALNIPAHETVELSLLGQGEYNLNYTFRHPVTGQKLVLRVNTGSQMHLQDQIGYEYGALKLLEPCGRTPKAFSWTKADSTCPMAFW